MVIATKIMKKSRQQIKILKNKNALLVKVNSISRILFRFLSFLFVANAMNSKTKILAQGSKHS